MSKKVALGMLIYCCLGGYGAMWVSDSFDAERTLLYGFFAIPAAVAFFSLLLMEPSYVTRSRVVLSWVYGALLVLFSWGNVLLVNALTSSKPEKVKTVYKDLRKDRAINLAMKRGGLGMLYRTRW